MQKISQKSFYILFFSTVIIILLFFLLIDYIVTLSSPDLLSRLAIFSLASVLLSIILILAVSVIDPIIADTILNSRKYQRIESLSSPLLLRLSTDAPGTFHHSLNVSNLAQRAAKSIGVDSLLIRTAAFYHDIGKLIDPAAYIENQSDIEIPHSYDGNSIKKAAEKIISHAKAGVEIAKQSTLPEEIVDLIAQHHGTSYALYFYEKAKEQGLKIKKTDFRYAGPVPLSKEAGILMLADAVEATARAYPNLTFEKITRIVSDTISDKIAENQLKSSGLSENDLARIKASLEESLRSIYHQRIAYSGNAKVQK